MKLGVDTRTGETVAIKIMYKDNMSARAAQQLRREITSMKALNHPNVLRLKDVHEVRESTNFLRHKRLLKLSTPYALRSRGQAIMNKI